MRVATASITGLFAAILLGTVACQIPSGGATADPTGAAPEMRETAVVMESFSGTYVVAVDIATLRDGPGAEYPLLGQVTQGFVLELDGISASGDWVHTTAGGWVPLGFLTELAAVDPTATAPSTAVPSEQLSPTAAAVPTASTMPTLAATTTAVAPVACGPPAGWVVYSVLAGDTLFALAERTGTSVAALQNANCLPDDRIAVGQQLLVPRLPDATTGQFAADTPSPTSTTAIIIKLPSATPTLSSSPTPSQRTRRPTPLPRDTPRPSPTPGRP